MTTSERSTVVGVFTDAAQAEQAIDELGRVGFSDDEVSVSKGGAESGGFMDRVKGLFTGQAAAPLTTADDFMRMGVPEQDAGFYQSEVEAGRTVVLVRAAGLQKEASGILHLHGAYDVATRGPQAQA